MKRGDQSSTTESSQLGNCSIANTATPEISSSTSHVGVVSRGNANCVVFSSLSCIEGPCDRCAQAGKRAGQAQAFDKKRPRRVVRGLLPSMAWCVAVPQPGGAVG